MLSFEEVIGQKENQFLIDYLNAESYAADLKFIMDEERIEKQKSKLETHPDMVELLWGNCIKKIPIRCQAIFLGKAVLINPSTGIVFALAEGTYPLLLRLSQTDLNALLHNGAKIILSNMDGIYADARKFGNNWIYCFSFIEGLEDYFIDAYEYSNSN